MVGAIRPLPGLSEPLTVYETRAAIGAGGRRSQYPLHLNVHDMLRHCEDEATTLARAFDAR